MILPVLEIKTILFLFFFGLQFLVVFEFNSIKHNAMDLYCQLLVSCVVKWVDLFDKLGL